MEKNGNCNSTAFIWLWPTCVILVFVTRIWVNQEDNCCRKLHFVSDILNVVSKMAFPNSRWSAASVRYLVFRTSACRTQKKLCVNKADVAYSPSLQ